MKKINDDAIITRCLMALNCNKRKDLAKLLNITPQNLSGYIDRGTFINLIEPLIHKNKINIHWIKTGQGSMTAGHGTGTFIGEQDPSYHVNHAMAQAAPDIKPIHI